jgi:hypothetical protein
MVSNATFNNISYLQKIEKIFLTDVILIETGSVLYRRCILHSENRED